MQENGNRKEAGTQGRVAALASTMAFSLACVLPSGAAWAQKFPITAQQRTTAQQAATRGVPLSELSANAPDTYVVKSGDTLWAIAESQYGKGKGVKHTVIFEANRPMLSHPDKIYPGQVLRIPELES